MGIEYDERIFRAALSNRESAAAGGRTLFTLGRAEDCPLPPEADRIFFFNPFSEEILRKVMTRIRESWFEAPREILLFFYYPSDEYMIWLNLMPEVEHVETIDCGDLFNGKDERERIEVFRLQDIESIG